MYQCSKKLVTYKEYSCFEHSDFPTHSMFTFDVCWGTLGTSIFGNSSSSANNTRSRLPSRLSFSFLWLWFVSYYLHRVLKFYVLQTKTLSQFLLSTVNISSQRLIVSAPSSKGPRHSLSLAVPLVVTRCTTRCHSSSLIVLLVVTRCRSLSLNIPLVCLFINDPEKQVNLANRGLFWKSLVSFFRITYALSVGFKMKPLRESVF